MGNYIEAVISVLDNTIDRAKADGKEEVHIEGNGYEISFKEINAMQVALTIIATQFCLWSETIRAPENVRLCAEDMLRYHAECQTVWADSPSITGYFKENLEGVGAHD